MLKTLRNILRAMAGPFGVVDMIVDAASDLPRLAPHQQRVVEEKAELDEKIGKLRAFFDTAVFGGLSEFERNLLGHQYQAMGRYSFILGDRIAAFGGAPAAPVEAVLNDVRIVPAAGATPTQSPVADLPPIEAPSLASGEVVAVVQQTDRWQPTIGRIVTVKGPIANGTDEHPGMITRVFGAGEGALVNVTAFPDLSAPKILSSIPAYTSRTAARDALVGPSRANGYAFFPDRG